VSLSFSSYHRSHQVELLFRHVDYSLKSPYGGGRPGRVKRKRAKAATGGGEDGEEAEEEDE